MAGPMHDDEASTSIDLVGRLLADQFPQWAGLPVTAVRSAGTDHAIYRLGDEMAVRLPLRPSAAGQVEKEQLWLPRLAPQLPCPISRPLSAWARLGRAIPGNGRSAPGLPATTRRPGAT